jgi:RNA polymerase sigma factor (TIGR02999 family)
MAELSPEQQSVTQLLHEVRLGNKDAFDALMPVVYDQMRKLAARCMAAERGERTIPATALVHEAYMRLVGSDIAWEDRVHFFAVSARVMRRILVDHAKANKRQKRGGGAERMTFDEAVLVGPEAPSELVELDEALDRLATHDARKSKIVELLFFGGMTYDETAAALGVSPATVHRELRMAKAWLYRELAQNPA